MTEWRIAGPLNSVKIKNYDWVYIYHNHEDYWFMCANLRNGLMCGLCGTLVPNYILIQLKLLHEKSVYDSYHYAPDITNKIGCVYNNRQVPMYLTKDCHYWFSKERSIYHVDKITELIEKYKTIWQDILL